jgi:hypothetical protein
MAFTKGRRFLISVGLMALLLPGAALAQPSSLIQAGPLVAQDSNRVGNYSYMRDRRRGYDPRYQMPGTVYRNEYSVDRSAPVYPAGPNDPRFQNGNDPNYDNPYLDPRYREAYRRDPNAWVNRSNGAYYPAGNSSAVAVPAQPYYDGNGNRIRFPQPGQAVYDAAGNRIPNPNIRQYDANGNPLTSNRTYYDAQGHPSAYPPQQGRAMNVGPFRIHY